MCWGHTVQLFLVENKGKNIMFFKFDYNKYSVETVFITEQSVSTFNKDTVLKSISIF